MDIHKVSFDQTRLSLIYKHHSSEYRQRRQDTEITSNYRCSRKRRENQLILLEHLCIKTPSLCLFFPLNKFDAINQQRLKKRLNWENQSVPVDIRESHLDISQVLQRLIPLCLQCADLVFRCLLLLLLLCH